VAIFETPRKGAAPQDDGGTSNATFTISHMRFAPFV
jgi:hypothetical protein